MTRSGPGPRSTATTAGEGPIHPGSGRGASTGAGSCAPLGAAGLLLLKLGAKLKALLFLLPKIKLFTTSGTMLVSVAAYSLIWGWRFAVGFVLLLFVHEMGHVIQLRREGIKASAPMFIPFLGAVIWAKSLGGNALAEARVGLAGPGARQPRRGGADPGGRRDRQRPLPGARVHRLLPQPLQPAAGRAARRRPRDGGAVAVDVVRRASPRWSRWRSCSRTRSCC